MTRRDWFAGICVALTPVLAVLSWYLLSPEYFVSRGFPLDDAWIHMVYGRELALSGTLAYNPGEPATGATSVGWAFLLAVPHLVTEEFGTLLRWVKFQGVGLHCLTTFAVFMALVSARRRDIDEASDDWERYAVAVAGGAFVGLHPDLVAASVSGMEIPLATAVAAGQRPRSSSVCCRSFSFRFATGAVG